MVGILNRGIQKKIKKKKKQIKKKKKITLSSLEYLVF